jgi:hypothetical protein
VHHSKIARPMLPMGRVQSIDHGSALKVRSRRKLPVQDRTGDSPLATQAENQTEALALAMWVSTPGLLGS